MTISRGVREEAHPCSVAKTQIPGGAFQFLNSAWCGIRIPYQVRYDK